MICYVLQQCVTHCSDLVCTENYSWSLSYEFNDKGAIREKAWGYSSLCQMFSPLAICNPFDFYSPFLKLRLGCNLILDGVISLFPVGSCSYNYVDPFSLHWFRVAVFSQQDSWGKSKILFSGHALKKYFEKQDQEKPERWSVFLQQLQQGLNFLKPLL